MKKIFTAIATALVTHFIMKTVDKIKNPHIPSHEELHKEVLRKKRLYEELQYEKRAYEESRRSEPKVNVHLRSIGEFAAQYRENVSLPKEPCDGAALRPRMDMATTSNFEPTKGVNR